MDAQGSAHSKCSVNALPGRRLLDRPCQGQLFLATPLGSHTVSCHRLLAELGVSGKRGGPLWWSGWIVLYPAPGLVTWGGRGGCGRLTLRLLCAQGLTGWTAACLGFSPRTIMAWTVALESSSLWDSVSLSVQCSNCQIVRPSGEGMSGPQGWSVLGLWCSRPRPMDLLSLRHGS